MLKIADVATRALTVDQGLDSAGKLLGLARSLTGLSAKNVTLLTMPTVPDPANMNRLLPEEPADDVIFQMILTGQTWRHRLPTRPDHQVRVRVLNGTGIAGLAGQTARRLARLGFDVTGTADGPATSTTTVTYSGTVQADSAYTLMTALKATPAAQNLLAEPVPQTGRPGPVTLVIGSDFTGVTAAAAPHPTAGHPAAGGTGTGGADTGATGTGGQAAVQSRNAGASICSGLPAANPDPGTP